MLKTIVLILLLTPAITFATLSVSVKPVLAPLVDSTALSCPNQLIAMPDDIQAHYFAVPPTTLKWTGSDQSFVIDSAHITINYPNQQAKECDVLPAAGMQSLLPFYWTTDGKQTLDPADSGKEFKQSCTLKCGGLPAADPTLKIMSAFIEFRGHTMGSKPPEEYSTRAPFFITAPN